MNYDRMMQLQHPQMTVRCYVLSLKKLLFLPELEYLPEPDFLPALDPQAQLGPVPLVLPPCCTCCILQHWGSSGYRPVHLKELMMVLSL